MVRGSRLVPSMGSRGGRLIIKIVISALLIILVIRFGSAAEILQRIRRVELTTFLGAVLALLALAPVQSLRWCCVIRALHRELSFRAAFPIVLMSYFFNQTLPSSIGGDAIRVWNAHAAGIGLGAALNSVILDRLVALIALLLLVGVSLPWTFDIMPNQATRAGLVTAIAASLAGLAVVFSIKHVPPGLMRWKWMHALPQLSHGLGRLITEPRYGIPALVYAIASPIAIAAICFGIARGLAVELSLSDCILLIPPVMLISMIPASIAGWGVREGAMVVALGLVQVPANDAVSISLLYGVILLVSGIPGGIVWLVSTKAPAVAKPTQSRN